VTTTLGDDAKRAERENDIDAVRRERDAYRDDVNHLVRQGRARELAYKALQERIASMQRVMDCAEADNREICDGIRAAAEDLREALHGIGLSEHDGEQQTRCLRALEALNALIREVTR
jgi:chromosome segregation ATPase